MNLGPLIVLFKFLKDAGGLSPTLVGPPAPEPTGPGGIPSYCVRTDGKLTYPCWQQYIEPDGSYLDWTDYLSGK